MNVALSPSTPLVLEGGVFALAVLCLLWRVTGTKTSGRGVGWMTLAGLVLLFGASMLAVPGGRAIGGDFVLDGLALFAKRLFLASAALSVLASLAVRDGAVVRRGPEYHFVMLASLLGMLALASARDLLLLFVSFELMSIPLYILTGFNRREGPAAEAALKFFLVGTVSSALFLYGLSFIYGVTGSTQIAGVTTALQTPHTLLTLGLSLVLAGLGFKIATVPFHMWVPDSYEAGGTSFVAWLSLAPKAAGFLVILRLYVEGVGTGALIWLPLLATLSGMTIVAGNLMAIPQNNIKRLLAYSGVAHIGYMVMGLAALSSGGVSTVLFYLVAYLFGNMGAFFCVQAVGDVEGSDSIDAYKGLAQRSPVLALALLVFLLSLGGIPFVAGFWAKLYVFWAAIDRGMYALAFLGALLTVVALYYYLLVARRMYIDAPPRPEPVAIPNPLKVAIGVCAVGVVVMGAYPEPWVRAVMRIAQGLF